MEFENRNRIHRKLDFTDPDTVCGFGGFKPKWLQKMATPRMFLICFSISSLILSTYYNYLVGMLSTLEKRYAIPTKVSGSLMISEEIVPLFLNIVCGYFGGKSHRPRLIALGFLLSAFCCFFTALPYFIYGSAKQLTSYSGIKNDTSIEVCDSNLKSSSCDVDEKPSKLLVVGIIALGNFLKGFSNVTINTIAIPYMDDNSKKKNVPIYLGISLGIRLFGPLFGFLLSSATLRYYENPFEDPGYGPEDPRWVGAWWIGFLLQGFLLVIAAVPVGLFPRKLPGFTFPGETTVQIDGHNVIRQKESLKDLIIGMFQAFKRIFKNPVFLLMMFSTVMKIYGHFGHEVMMPKYVENQFRMSASDANLYSGATSLTVIMIATVLGGFFIWKFKPSKKILLILMFVTESFLFVGMIILTVPRCQHMEMKSSGKSLEGLLILNSSCNDNCDCTTSSYTPYCGSDGKTLFFSPCFAGCPQEALSILPGNKKKVYSNCSCSSEEVGKIIEGYCPDETCWNQALLYISIYLVIVFSASFLNVFDTVLVLRSVDPKDKSLALGAFETAMSLFGFMPFPVAFGALVDSTCLVWEKNCDTTGNCWFYDMDLYNYSLHGAASIFIFFCGISFIGMYFCRHRIRNLYDEEGEENDNSEVKQDMVSNSETKL